MLPLNQSKLGERVTVSHCIESSSLATYFKASDPGSKRMRGEKRALESARELGSPCKGTASAVP
jgi:hypothetical protein